MGVFLVTSDYKVFVVTAPPSIAHDYKKHKLRLSSLMVGSAGTAWLFLSDQNPMNTNILM